MKYSLIISAAMAALCQHAFADIVYKTEAGAGWTVTRTTSSQPQGSGDYRTFPYDGVSTTAAAVNITNANSFWTAGNDSRLTTAKWISTDATTGGTSADPFSTRYVFHGVFTVAQLSQLNLAFAADNLVDEVVLSSAANGAGTQYLDWVNTVTPIGDQGVVGVGRIWGFTQANVQSAQAIAGGTIHVTATMYNYGGPPVAGHFADGSSWGMIMAINATAVPEPASMSIAGSALAGLLLRRTRTKR